MCGLVVRTYPEILSYGTSDSLVSYDAVRFATERYLILPIKASLCGSKEVTTDDELVDADLLPRARGVFEKS